FGVILYEMATGQRPFTGETSISIISPIVKDTPKSVTDVNASLPREFGRIIRHALAKDPELRYQTAKDIRNDLTELRQSIESGELSIGPASTSIAVPNRVRWLVAACTIAALGGLAGGFWLARRGSTMTAAIEPPAQATVTQLTTHKGVEEFPTLSPDGKWFAYDSAVSGRSTIYLQSVGGRTPINLTRDSTADDSSPAFSPDGERIAFRSERAAGGIFLMG